MPDFLATFNKQNAKSYGGQKIGTGGKGLSFVDIFASDNDPKLRKKLTQYYKQQEEAKAVPIKQGLKKGMSWEDISAQTGVPLEEVQSISQKVDPNYGIKAPKPSLISQAASGVKNVVGSVKEVADDITGLSQTEQTNYELRRQVLENKKKEILSSGVLAPTTKAKVIKDLQKQQDELYKQRTSQLSSESTTLAKGQDAIRQPAAVGAGVVRSGEGLLQGVGGLTDLVTPGQGQNRLTQFATKSAEGTDQFVKDNNMNKGAYLGGQLVGEALQMLTGAKAIKALSAVPGTAKILAVAGKADDLENALMAVNKGGKVGERAIKTARYLLDPAKVANIAGNTAVDQGQLAARGQDINPLTVATSVGANYALGGVLDAASGGLNRLASNKANKLQDAATAVDNARINNAVDGGVDELVSGKPTAVAEDVVVQRITTDGNNTTKKEYFTIPKDKLEDTKLYIDNQRASDGTTTSVAGNRNTNGEVLHVTASSPAKMEASGFTNAGEFTLPNSTKPTAGVPEVKTTGSALATERRAIEDGIVKELPDKAQYSTGSYVQEADKAINLVKTDRARAEAIALGGEPGDNVIHEVAVRKALEAEARKNKDANLLQRIASSESNRKTSEAGQRLGAEGYNKDPESPVEAMKDVLNARKDTKLKGIPKDLSADEAAKITDLADKVATAKAKLDSGGDRFAYGEALVNLRRYKNELIDGTKTQREKLMPKGVINATFGTAKSIKASLDNSFFGRQGLKVLTTHPTVWGKAFMKSWGDIGKGLKGIDALDALDADTLSRANNLNGRYGKMKLDVHSTEEAFPSSLPEKVPGLGRLFKASEYAYVGAAHRMRADLADQILEKAQKAGVDIDDPKQLESIGKLINSMTGRGHLGKTEPAADTLNNLFFSPRNWKSNIDTITAHQLQKGVTPFVRKEAAKNLLKMVAVVGATLAAAENFKPGSVEKDPRSSDFGKIKIGNTRFDVSGGMASIATVASRLATRETKSTTTGQVTKLNGDEFGARSTWDVLMDYAEGKMSPGAGAIKQILTGKNFIGEKVTPASMAKDMFMPLPISNYYELRDDPKSANTLIAMIADGLGVGTNTYSAQKDWNQSNTKKISGFKQTVDAKKFSEANNAFNEAYSSWIEKVTSSDKFKKLPEQTQKTLLSQKSQDLTDEILKKYGYEYKTQRKSPQETQTIKDLKGL